MDQESSTTTTSPGPSGHALYVRNWRRVFAGEALEPRAFADRYRAIGLTWIALYLSSRGAGVVANRAEGLAEALERAGVEVWATWGLPEPATWRAELPRFLDRARAAGARGIVINPEAEWLDQPDEARAFALELERAGLPIVLSTYGTPQGVPSFPWSEFQRVTAAGMPELYDRDLSSDPAAYFERGIRGWHAEGFEVLDVAGSTWAHRGRRKKTIAELARHLSELPRTPANALWSPLPLDLRRVEILGAWAAGDLERLATLGRLGELPGRSTPRRSSGTGAGVFVAALSVLGLAGAVLRR